VTRAAEHLVTLTLRRVAKSSVLSVMSEKRIIKSKLRLIRSTDILAKFRADRSSSDTPAKELCSNEHDRRCSIFVSCNKCARIHDTGISLVMQHSPVLKHSLADLYKGKVPKPLKKLSRTIVTCPWTGRQSLQTDNRRIFLVPTNNSACQL
jgi:hypothetical protein